MRKTRRFAGSAHAPGIPSWLLGDDCESRLSGKSGRVCKEVVACRIGFVFQFFGPSPACEALRAVPRRDVSCGTQAQAAGAEGGVVHQLGFFLLGVCPKGILVLSMFFSAPVDMPNQGKSGTVQQHEFPSPEPNSESLRHIPQKRMCCETWCTPPGVE